MPKLNLSTGCYATGRKAVKERVERIPSKKLQTKLDIYEGLVRARELIDSAPEAKRGVSELARVAGIAEAHFSRSFRESFGMPPYQYVLERKLAKARALLASPDPSITEIAALCGFESLSAFINVFTREHRTSPSAYRKRELAGSSKSTLVPGVKNQATKRRLKCSPE